MGFNGVDVVVEDVVVSILLVWWQTLRCCVCVFVVGVYVVVAVEVVMSVVKGSSACHVCGCRR